MRLALCSMWPLVFVLFELAGNVFERVAPSTWQSDHWNHLFKSTGRNAVTLTFWLLLRDWKKYVVMRRTCACFPHFFIHPFTFSSRFLSTAISHDHTNALHSNSEHLIMIKTICAWIAAISTITEIIRLPFTQITNKEKNMSSALGWSSLVHTIRQSGESRNPSCNYAERTLLINTEAGKNAPAFVDCDCNS